MRKWLIKKLLRGMKPTPMVKYAETELVLAGLFDKDSDYGGDLAAGVLDLVRLLAAQRHSEMSVELTLSLFAKLAHRTPLTPLTGHASEWKQVGPDDKVLMNTRCPRVFCQELNGAMHAWDSQGMRAVHPDGAVQDYAVQVQFPYSPKTEVVTIDRGGEKL